MKGCWCTFSIVTSGNATKSLSLDYCYVKKGMIKTLVKGRTDNDLKSISELVYFFFAYMFAPRLKGRIYAGASTYIKHLTYTKTTRTPQQITNI